MDIDTMEQKGRRRKLPAAHDMPRRLVGSKCVDQRVPVYWDQTVPVWPLADSPAVTKLPARNADAATEASSLYCCCISSSRNPQCNTASSFQMVPSASPAGTMIFEDQSARASKSAVCSSNSSSNNNDKKRKNNTNNSIFGPPASTSTCELHQIVATSSGNGRSSWGFSTVPGQSDSCAVNQVAAQMPAGTPQRRWNSQLGGRAVLCPPRVTFDAIVSMYQGSLLERRRRPRSVRATLPTMKILLKRTGSSRIFVERRISRPRRNSSTVVNGCGSISRRVICSRSRSLPLACPPDRCASLSQVTQELHNVASWRRSWRIAMANTSQRRMGQSSSSCFDSDGGGSSLEDANTTQSHLHHQVS